MPVDTSVRHGPPENWNGTLPTLPSFADHLAARLTSIRTEYRGGDR
ncbi:hypothetical protein KBZ21_05625 [Streptomyces sp. A73]|nr:MULTISPECIES: hypothetical protein [unclassified Streptomyces]MBQ0862211.1 hypothetical protein [Streptomyces sp. RK75]MBQ1121797.1 hypothetical protein [Streptomyces sp. B15]MBQ1157648.1 hypothetical protein [Streptomyces sp. A73]